MNSGDALRKVRPGQPLNIPAMAYNAFIDAAIDYQNRINNLNQDAQPSSQQASIILVKNISNADQPQYAVMGINTPLILPNVNLEEFKTRVACACVIPSESTHKGRFVVLAEPIKAGHTGKAYVAGVCPVKVSLSGAQQSDRRYAEVVTGTTEYLEARSRGSAIILWRETGTGAKWALVRLGNIPSWGVVFPVTLVKTGGYDPPTWQYNVYDPDTGEPLGGPYNIVQAPHQWRRPRTAHINPATYGYAHYNASGQLVIGWVNETAEQVFPVSMTATSGLPGDDQTQASWVYSLRDPFTNESLATNVSPVAIPHHCKRPWVGYILPANWGLAYRMSDDTISLCWCNEIPEQAACAQ